MAVSNTNILIKRSSVSANPGTLRSGELAYSYSSNTLFIGTPGSNGYLEIGAWSNLTQLTAGTYGDATHIPSFTVDAHGKIINISNTSISTSITISGNTGSGTQNSGNTLTFQGNGTGIQTTVTTPSSGAETVSFSTDNTIVRSNTASVGPQTIGTDLSISGNLIVSGTYSYVNTSIVQTTDSMIELAANNFTGDVVDIGFYGLYNNGTSNNITGLVRDGGTKNYYLFANVAFSAATAANSINNNLFTQSNTATLVTNINSYVANITSSTTTTANITNAGIVTANIGNLTVTNLALTNALPIDSGGTNNTSFNPGSITFFDGTRLSNLPNTIFVQTGTGASNNTISSVSVDAYGRTTAATFSQISGLTVPQGGTGLASITLNGITYGNGTGNLGVTVAASTADQTWSNQILTVTNAGIPVWTSVMDGGGF